MKKIVDEWDIEMQWRCPCCGTYCPGMSGNERASLRCVHCGNEKVEADPWLMPADVESAKRLTGDFAALAHAGFNWSCRFCKSESRWGARTCEVCGAERYASEEVPQPPKPVEVRTPEPPAEPPAEPPKQPRGVASGAPCSPPDGGSSRPYREPPPPSPAPPPVEPPSQGRGREASRTMFVRVLVAMALGAATVGCVWYLVAPRHTTVRVESAHWRRTATLSERHDYAGEGWRRAAPNDVFEWSACEERQSGTVACHPHDCRCRQVPYDCRCAGGDDYRCRPHSQSYECNCHTVRGSCSTVCTSNRNGSARCRRECDSRTECDRCSRTVYDTCTHPRVCDTCYRTACDTCYDTCPVMEPWCRYRYHQWDVINRAELAGSSEPRWPPLEARGQLQRLVRDEDYTVRYRDLRDPERLWDRNPAYAEFVTRRVGQRYAATWTRSGGFTLGGIR